MNPLYPSFLSVVCGCHLWNAKTSAGSWIFWFIKPLIWGIYLCQHYYSFKGLYLRPLNSIPSHIIFTESIISNKEMYNYKWRIFCAKNNYIIIIMFKIGLEIALFSKSEFWYYLALAKNLAIMCNWYYNQFFKAEFHFDSLQVLHTSPNRCFFFFSDVTAFLLRYPELVKISLPILPLINNSFFQVIVDCFKGSKYDRHHRHFYVPQLFHFTTTSLSCPLKLQNPIDDMYYYFC